MRERGKLGWHLLDLKSNYQMLQTSKTGFTKVLLFYRFYPDKIVIYQSNQRQ